MFCLLEQASSGNNAKWSFPKGRSIHHWFWTDTGCLEYVMWPVNWYTEFQCYLIMSAIRELAPSFLAYCLYYLDHVIKPDVWMDLFWLQRTSTQKHWLKCAIAIPKGVYSFNCFLKGNKFGVCFYRFFFSFIFLQIPFYKVN